MFPIPLILMLIPPALWYIEQHNIYFFALLLSLLIYVFFYIKSTTAVRYFFFYTTVIVGVGVLYNVGAINLSIYDSMLLSFSLFIAPTLISENKHTIIYLMIGGGLFMLVLSYSLYFPSLPSLPAVSTVIEKLNFLPSVELENKNINMQSFLTKDENLIEIDLSPSSPSTFMSQSKSIVTLTFSHELPYPIQNLILGMETGLKGRKYGVSLETAKGVECINQYNCYIKRERVNPNEVITTSFIVTTPDCSEDVEASIYLQYTSFFKGTLTVFPKDGEYIYNTPPTPLTAHIKFSPDTFTYREGGFEFFINVYASLSNEGFRNAEAYYNSFALSVPKEVSLEYDKFLCPYNDTKEEENTNKRTYIFSGASSKCIKGKVTSTLISCKAHIDSGVVDQFLNSYQSFDIFIPYTFYGEFPYPFKIRGSDKRCKSTILQCEGKDCVAEYLDKEGYAMYIIIKNSSLLTPYFINDLEDVCIELFRGSKADYNCAYLKIYHLNPAILSYLKDTYGLDIIDPDRRVLTLNLEYVTECSSERISIKGG